MRLARRPGVETLLDFPAADSFVAQIEHFVACIRFGREPLTSGEEARRTLAVCLAARTGQPVQCAR